MEEFLKTLYPDNNNYKLLKKLEVKAIKKFKGHDGMPLVQGNLYLNSKKIAFISDDSWGGPLQIDIYDEEQFSSVAKWIEDAKMTYTSEYFPEPQKLDMELYLDELLAGSSMLADVRRTRKTKTWIKNGHEYYTYNAAFEGAFKAKYEAELKKSGEVVLNTFL